MLNLFTKEQLNQLKIIGINGKAGSGKDFIAKNYYPKYFQIAFADHFKYDLIGKKIRTYEEVYVTKTPETRHIMQEYGTEKGRNVYGEDVWISCTEAMIYNIFNRNHIQDFIFPDVRYDNEAQFIRNLGGIVISIESNRNLSTMDDTAKKHSSESDISSDLLDVIVTNNLDDDLASIKDQLSIWLPIK